MNIFEKIDKAIENHIAQIKINRQLMEILSKEIQNEIDKEILTCLGMGTINENNYILYSNTN